MADQRMRFDRYLRIKAVRLSDIDIELINKILNLSPAEWLALQRRIAQS